MVQKQLPLLRKTTLRCSEQSFPHVRLERFPPRTVAPPAARPRHLAHHTPTAHYGLIPIIVISQGLIPTINHGQISIVKQGLIPTINQGLIPIIKHGLIPRISRGLIPIIKHGLIPSSNPGLFPTNGHEVIPIHTHNSNNNS